MAAEGERRPSPLLSTPFRLVWRRNPCAGRRRSVTGVRNRRAGARASERFPTLGYAACAAARRRRKASASAFLLLLPLRRWRSMSQDGVAVVVVGGGGRSAGGSWGADVGRAERGSEAADGGW
ncbi:Hypothetical predicted protein [Podarcis lilfordi]|uniref:Uncharacterized protein n=1 Tax=Podarcis lilfordi TaxID=74358 RepID=A0AA35PAG6_9SAUR|nr:Hypothetical predicted protein [Podarcis lilfordi]